MKEVQDIIGKEETRELKAEMNDMLSVINKTLSESYI